MPTQPHRWWSLYTPQAIETQRGDYYSHDWAVKTEIAVETMTRGTRVKGEMDEGCVFIFVWNIV